MFDRADRWWYLSSRRMTVLVGTREDKVIDCPPIVRKFTKQPLSNLIRWMRKQGSFTIVEIKASDV